MWIRSQDKTTLIKSEYITIYGNVIKVVCSDTTCITIGEYSSQEKALKVLDWLFGSFRSDLNLAVRELFLPE